MPIDSNLLKDLTFNADGLIPAVIQSNNSGRVLMMAWMNHESLSQSIEMGETVFWSRSRKEIWHKGANSETPNLLFQLKLIATATLY